LGVFGCGTSLYASFGVVVTSSVRICNRGRQTRGFVAGPHTRFDLMRDGSPVDGLRLRRRMISIASAPTIHSPKTAPTYDMNPVISSSIGISEAHAARGEHRKAAVMPSHHAT
jgi:hypothetical protein